jgi:preprotein translocase subunit YajC
MGHRSHFTACLPCILRGVVLNKKPLFRLACDQLKALNANLHLMFAIFLAQAPAPAPGAGSGLISMLPFVFIFVIMYYVMLRPQMRKQKEQAKLVSALKTGDRVVTSSGIHGLISNVKDTTVIVKVADNVKLEMEKTAVTNVVKTVES